MEPRVNEVVTRPVVVVVPLTVTDSFPNVIRLVSTPCPIVSVPMLTLPISNEPPVKELVPISIFPNVLVIEPAVSIPTSVIPPLEDPFATYLSSD